MNKKRFLNSLVAVFLTFLALWGSLGCLATGMDLGHEPADLLMGCLLIALCCGFLLDSKLWLLPVCLAALLVGYWWQEGALRLAFEGMLYEISDLYDRGYGWGILQWSDRHLLPQDLTPALLALGLPIAAAVSLTVSKGRLGFVGILLPIGPLAACLVLKDTVPSSFYLGLLLFAVVMLLLTQRVRSLDLHQANTLTLTLTLPLTLALALLFTFCPEDTYNMQHGAQQLEDWVISLLDAAAPEGPALIPGDQDRTIDLASVDQKQTNHKRIMTVRGHEDATIYLRGCAYDVYDGTSWSSTPGWNAWNLFYTASGSEVKSLEIKTEQPHSVYYFTYTPYAAPAKVLGGRMRNDEGLTSYTVYYQDPVAYGEQWDSREDAIGGQDLAEYLQLPDSTRQAALEILTKKVGIPGETYNAGQIWRNAQYIAEWVSHRAKYDLNTGPMPKDAEDFALWFINDADTGYCTHYATAATVLLRAAGIPAQYVTGYLVEVKNGRVVNVTEDNAHAWVEVFINGMGWVMLEPTPSGGLTQTVGGNEGETLPSSPTEATEPSRSTEPTESGETTPTETTAPTQGSETTVPTETEAFSHPTATVESSAGIGNFGGADPGAPTNQALSKPLQTLLLSLLALALAVAQWRIRVAVQRLRFRHGEPNRRALRIWKALVRACRLLKQSPEAECLLLAQKARFSQHTLTEEELQMLLSALSQAHGKLKKRLLLQPICTLILALY